MRIFTASYTAQADSTYAHGGSVGLSGASKNDMLIAGGSDTYAAEKFNGVSWSSAGSLPSGITQVTTNAGWATNDCIAIQAKTTNGTARYNGASWSTIEDPPQSDHYAAACGPPTNLAYPVYGHLYKFDGTTWTTSAELGLGKVEVATGSASRLTCGCQYYLIARYDNVTQRLAAFRTPVELLASTTIDADSMFVLRSYGPSYYNREVSFIDEHCVVGTSSAPTLATAMGGGLRSCLYKNGKTTYSADITVALFFAPDIVSGKTYYVDVENGNDANDGSSVETAWATLTKALSEVKVGDKVIIAPGVYRETLTFSTRSSSDNPIVLEGDVAGKYFGRQGVVRITNLMDDLNPPSATTSTFYTTAGLTLRRVHLEYITSSPSMAGLYSCTQPLQEQFSALCLEDTTIFGNLSVSQNGFLIGRRAVMLPRSFSCSYDFKGFGTPGVAPSNYYQVGHVLIDFFTFFGGPPDNYNRVVLVGPYAERNYNPRLRSKYGIFTDGDTDLPTLLPRNFRELQVYDFKTLWALALNFHHSVYKGEVNDTWPEDIFGIPRYRKMPGCFAPKVYSLDFDVYRNEPPSVKLEGGGHYTFLLPFRGGSTVTVWVKFTGEDKPRLRLWGPILGEVYVDAAGDGTAWEELTLQVDTNDVCLVSFIFPTYSDTNVAYFSDFDVTKVGA